MTDSDTVVNGGNLMDKYKLLIDLFNTQKLAVLATESDKQPHNCLVAFAYTDDLKHMIFATKRETNKFQDIIRNPKIAILIDNRSNGEEDFKQAIAVTAKGIAVEPTYGEHAQLSDIYLSRHPYLGHFLADKDVAFLKIEVSEYLIVRFNSTEVFYPV